MLKNAKSKDLTPVAIERCERYSAHEVREAITRALSHFGGISAFVKKGQRVLLKPNLLAPATAEEAVTTHPVFIQEAAKLVMEEDAMPFIGDSPSFGSATQVATRAGILDVARKLGIELVEFKDPVRIKLEKRFYPGIGPVIDRAVLDADVVISLPKIKAHQQIGYTGAVKNMFGCMNGKRKALRHVILGHRPDYFGKMLLEIFYAVRPAITIADGIVGMEGEGPRKGRPKQLGVVVAGQDGVAVDLVIGEILGARQEPVYITAARELGLGPESLKNIEILGCSIEEVKSKDFKFPVIYPIGFNPFRLIKSVAKDLLMRIGY